MNSIEIRPSTSERGESSTDFASDAMTHSSLAANYMQQQDYEQALLSYQEALMLYRRDYMRGEVVEKCNAAATLHNMGLLHKRCKRLHQSIACLEEAETLYRECSAQAQPQNTGGDGVCLEYLLAETLQNRANLHSKYQHDVLAAIDCHEEVVAMLLDLGYLLHQAQDKRPRSPSTGTSPTQGSVTFVRITDDQRVHLLSISLRSLGNLYLQQGEQDDALGAYQEALDMMRCQQTKHPDLKLQKKIASILLSMACVYFSQNELDQAVTALDECISSHGGDQTHPDVMTALNNLGLAYERKGDLDKAMQCYEDLVQLKRRQLGENHVEVAAALITVAKMLERQGNMTEALVRYQEALEIYRGAISHENSAFDSIISEILSKISALSNDVGSVDNPDSACQQADTPSNTPREANGGETRFDEAGVFLQLARSFKEKESYQAAKDCLTEVRHILRPLPQNDGRAPLLLKEVGVLESSLANVRASMKGGPSEPPRLKMDPVGIKHSGDHTADSVEDPPLLLLPSLDSNATPVRGVDVGEQEEPLSPLLLQDIKHAGSENNPATEAQRVAVEKSESSLSGSASTRSVTPESSLEDPTTPFSNQSEFDKDTTKRDLTGDQYPDPELQLAVLDALELSDSSSVPEENIPDVSSKSQSLRLAAESSVDHSEFSLPTITPVVSDAVESGVCLNAHSQDTSVAENEMPVSLNLLPGPTESSSRSCEDSDGSQRDESRRAPYGGDIEIHANALEVEDRGIKSASRSPQFPESEYESFGEGSMLDSMLETDNDITDFENSEFELTDLEDSELEYATEEDEQDGPEEIYWDEEENREVLLTDSQFSDAEEEAFAEAYAFQTPLGLEKGPVEESRLKQGTAMLTADEGSEWSDHLAGPAKTTSWLEQSPQKSLDPKASPRHRFVKALSRPFRRKSHSMSSKLEPTPEDSVPEIVEDTAQRQLDLRKADVDDDTNTLGNEEFSGPIEFIQLESVSSDDNVSQITVRRDDFLSRKSDSNDKWWSEGWFPAVFADIAEEFLSAKSIHNKGRKPHDDGTYSTSSGDDSDPFDDLQSEMDPDETKTDGRSETHSATETSASLNPNYEVRGDKSMPVNAPDGPTRGPNVEGIVGEVNSTLWKPNSMVALSTNRRSESPRSQLRINSLEKGIEQEKMVSGHNSEKVAGLLVALALLRVECGDADLAVDALLEALSIQKAMRDPLAMSRSLHVLADIYSSQEEYDLALACYSDVQHIERRLFGPDHPETANTLNKIGRVFANQGRFYQAMEKHQQALQVLKACVGEDLSHPAVSQTLIHIGEVYYRERNSLSTIRDNADDYKRFIETGMLDVIARAHEDRGSYKIALGFMEEKLQLIKNENSSYPEDELAQILFNIGNLSCKSGVFLEAIDYYQQALEIQVRRGCTDVEIATAKVLIGTVEYHLGQYRKALNLLEAALVVFEKEFGDKHEVVADTLHRIALVKSALWYHDDAMETLVRALQLQLQLFGDHDLEVYKTRLEMCWIEVNQGGSVDCVSHVKGIMRKQQDLVGASHPIIADTLLLLGKVHLLTGKRSKGVKVLQESLKMRERFLGRDHPLQAETFHLIALEGIRREKFHKALGMCKSVLNIRRETLGERHVEVASTLDSLGRCYVGTGKFKEALECFNEALQVAQLSVGENHPCVGDIYTGKGIFHLRKCQFEAAKEAIEKGIAIYETSEVDDANFRLKEAEKLLERVERDEMLCV